MRQLVQRWSPTTEFALVVLGAFGLPTIASFLSLFGIELNFTENPIVEMLGYEAAILIGPGRFSGFEDGDLTPFIFVLLGRNPSLALAWAAW